MGLKNNESAIRFWLDPKKRDTTTPVPGWEGVYNSSPNYMDIALYCMMSLDKDIIKNQMKIQKHLSFVDLLKINRVNTDSLVPCIPHMESRKDKIFFVNSREMGFVIGYTKFDELDKFKPPLDKTTYNAALIKFEDLYWEPVFSAKANRVTRDIKPQHKILTMYDQNFILAKDCDMVSYEELEQYMKNYNKNDDLNNSTPQNTVEKYAG